MSSADLITCSCKTCNTLLCVSTNNWTEITSSYATYDVVHLFSHPGLEQSGPMRPGSKESELEGCTVQPLNCVKCKDSIGVKCVGVVPEKEIHRDRCFLKLGKLNMKDLAGNPVEASIKFKEGVGSDAKASGQTKRQMRAVQDTNARNGANGRSISEEPENEESQSQNEVLQIVQRQDGDIVVILQNLQALQQEMRDFRDHMEAMKTDTDEIRARQEGEPSQQQTEEIEVLTETVTKVSSKLGEVESLKLEIKLMQSRLKRLEDEKRVPQRIIGPPLTPRSGTNGSASTPSFDSALNKRLGSSNLKSPFGMNGPDLENVINRSRASSVQLDYGHIPTIPSGLKNSRAASVQGEYIRPTPTQPNMPPPPIPNRVASQIPTGLRSASEAPRNPHTQSQSNLHNAISALNESATEFPTMVEDSDDEYNEEDPSPDPDDDPAYHSRGGRQSLPNPTTCKIIDSELNPEQSSKRRRTTTSHAIDRDETSPHPDDPSYKSVWADPSVENQRSETPMFHQRNEQGQIIKPNGQIDKRSLRFLGRAKRKRRHLDRGARDDEGYLLKADGSRNERSVSIINGMRKRDQEMSS